MARQMLLKIGKASIVLITRDVWIISAFLHLRERTMSSVRDDDERKRTAAARWSPDLSLPMRSRFAV